MIRVFLGPALFFLLTAFPLPAEAEQASKETELTSRPKPASEHTLKINRQMYDLMDFGDQQEFQFARKGLLAAPEALELKDADGKVLWSQKAYAFLDAQPPETVNPSLWRNAQLNHIYGLFEVSEGIYQVRGYDMSNISFIAGQTGWIVFDPLMSVECARAALELVNAHLGERPVTAVVMSHPHVDHYGGIKGIVSEEEVREKSIPVIAPEGFEEHAVSENVYAGVAMGRRAGYQYGTLLESGAEGSVAIGIGLGQSKGAISYISPNDLIGKTGETRLIDGVEMEFQMTPGTEAPVEMNIWFPERKALWLAENCTGTMHNLYTLRGAQVRDGNAWSKYIMEALTRYGDRAEVVFQAHNWPRWGAANIRSYMENTAAVYKFINDQTLMHINQGYTPNEIAHKLHLPPDLAKFWYTRPYYGTVAHNSKAVYQRYMGWYDAHPAHLNALAPSESAKKFVEYLGDLDEVLRKARQDFEAGNYQWVAELCGLLVFADPGHREARLLGADALEQLAYQAESGTWRNAYLSGALELRQGTVQDLALKATGGSDTQRAMPPEMIFDYLGIRLDSIAAQDLNLKINFRLRDEGPYLVTVRSGVLLYQKGLQAEDADATLALPKEGLLALTRPNPEALKEAVISGNPEAVAKLSEHMVSFDFFFNIVEPGPALEK